MKKQQFALVFCYLLGFSLLLLFGCATSPILKISKDLPNIVKEYKHLTIHEWDFDQISTGIYLEKGEFFSILVDAFHKRFYLSVSIEENGQYVMGNYYLTNSPKSGYLFIGNNVRKRHYKTGIDIIVWKRQDWDQIAGFLEQMNEKDPDNIEIATALSHANEYKGLYIAEAKANSEIEKTKKELLELKGATRKEKEHTVSFVLKGKEGTWEKPLMSESGKQEKVAHLEKKLTELNNILAQLEKMKSELASERKRTRILTKELTEKGKKEKDLLAELERRAKTPPVIAIASPLDGSKVEIDRIQLTGVAQDDQAVERLDIFVNNKPLRKKIGRGLLVIEGEYPSRVDFSERIQLQKGKNQIKIRALDSDGLSSEKVITIEYIVKHKKIWAVIIGIDNYENVRQLRYAVNDAKAFYEYLIHHNQIPKENITLLLNKEASLSKLRSVLGTQLKRKARKEDMVIIYYAGHGAAEKDSMSPDGDGLEKYLLPYNANPRDLYASALPMREISHIFSRIRSERLILIVDSCYSGASSGRTISLAGVRANISDEFLDRIASGKGRIILTASGANEVSAEDEKLKHGLFTYFLLEGLRGKADTDRDGLITVDEAYRYVSKHVPQATGQEQNPVKKGTVRGRLILGIVN